MLRYNRNLFTKATFVVVLSLVCHVPALAAPRAANELDLKTERAIVFKDGYTLVIKRGEAVTDKNGEAFTDDVPDAAVLGSFWALPDQGRLISMLAGWQDVKDSETREVPCAQTIEVLLANQGKQAKVELHDKTLYSGQIHQVLTDKSEAAVSNPQLEMLDLIAATPPQPLVPGTLRLRSPAAAAVAPTAVSRTLTAYSGANFVLRTDEGDILLPAAQVRSLVIKDMKTTLLKTLTSARRSKRLTFKFDGPEKKQAVTLMYFRPGVRWIPSYRLQLADGKKALTSSIDLQAELLNEAENFTDVPVDIVVGVPNFRFREIPSPLTLEAVLRNALAEAAPAVMGNQSQSLSNAMYSQRSGEFRRAQAQANDVADGAEVKLPGELTATGSQDLFVYSLPKLTLAKGERMAVPIFSATAPYRDIYTWDVRITRQDTEAAPSGAGVKSPLVLSKNEVWHQLLLTNATNLPWTTGAAIIFKGQQPLAQELLTYTPPKDEVRVPVTVSVDTRGSLVEKETGRELKALTWDGYNYARIEKELQLDLCNNKPIDIEAEITLHVGGKVTQASNEGAIILSPFNQADWVNYQGHPAVNNSSVITWKVKLKPGEKFEPMVKYQYYSRH